jgi:trehalose synthase
MGECMPAVTIEPVPVSPIPLARLAEVLLPEQRDELESTVARGLPLLEGRVVWNINSTARGGGVAEMLRSLVGYARAAGVDARWLVVGSEPDFFHVTKRLHNHLHGSPGDGGPLGEHEREIYERTSRAASERLSALVRAGDVVVLHDPQTAGLAAPLVELGANVVWRAHIGLDLPNECARNAWAFLLPYVRPAHAYVFSREAYAWEGLDPARVTLIAPSIDPFSAKNQGLDPARVKAILLQAGLLSNSTAGAPTFLREDASPGRVDSRAELIDGTPPPVEAALVTQVSRWDRLKDPLGVMEGFVRHVLPESDAHLMLAGPDVRAVADDPEGEAVVEACTARWESLAPEARERIHLALLPMDDAQENAAIVNALQRWSTVIVQKSLAEGFGLTVTEAMWKATPVVAGRIGGIQDQVADGETGLLVDPTDLPAFGAAVLRLLRDPEGAQRMGAAARELVRKEFLGVRHLTQYVDLFEALIRARVAIG